eukprot:scaffold2691_cov417-Prasinococcus_capsulatus_cf.AAC.24
MNSIIKGANAFSPDSIDALVAYRDTLTCLEEPTCEVINVPQVSSSCCGDLNWKFNGPSFPDVCGESPGCQTLAWEDALSHCESLGARLCTVEDHVAAHSTGCSFNGNQIWTQSPCNGGNGFLAVSAKQNQDLADPVCVDPSVKLPVRCCADACQKELPQKAVKSCSELPAFAFKDEEDHPTVCGSTPGCVELNWDEAYDHCGSLGARLCTDSDIDAAWGTGCSYNNLKTWTQTQCVDPVTNSPGYQTVTTYKEAQPASCSDRTEVLPVRCCADSNTYPLPQLADACCGDGGLKWSAQDENNMAVCGSSPGCQMLSWPEAYDHCHSMGARLCSSQDIKSATSTGCSFNKELVWTQTPCQEEGITGFRAMKGSPSSDYGLCLDPSSITAVRCCVDACQ